MRRSRFVVGTISATSAVGLIGAGSKPLGLAMALMALERRTQTQIGLAVVNAAGSFVIDHRSHERLPLASTQKLPLVMAVLAKHDLSSAQPIRIMKSDLMPGYSEIAERYPNGAVLPLDEICARTISQSDNTGAEVLVRLLGGPQAVTAYLRSIGITDVRVDRTERQLPEKADRLDLRDTGTPAAMARLVWRLAYDSPLPSHPTQKLIRWMLATTTGDHRIRAGVPSRWRVADKTGSYRNVANDIGLMYPPQKAPIAIACSVYGAETDDDAHVIVEVVRTIGPLLAATELS